MNIQLKEQNENKDIPVLDLSKHLDIESEDFKSKKIITFSDPKAVKSYKELFDHIYNQVQDSLRYKTQLNQKFERFNSDSNDRSLKRFVFPNFFATFCQLNFNLFEIIKFFQSLRSFARTTYCTFVFTMRFEDNEELRNNLRFIFDYVISLEVLKS